MTVTRRWYGNNQRLAPRLSERRGNNSDLFLFRYRLLAALGEQRRSAASLAKGKHHEVPSRPTCAGPHVDVPALSGKSGVARPAFRRWPGPWVRNPGVGEHDFGAT